MDQRLSVSNLKSQSEQPLRGALGECPRQDQRFLEMSDCLLIGGAAEGPFAGLFPPFDARFRQRCLSEVVRDDLWLSIGHGSETVPNAPSHAFC